MNPTVKATIELQKEESKAKAILAKAKTEDNWKKFQDKVQHIQTRVKGGAEKVVTWYEDNWLNTVFGGVIMGTAMMLFAQVLAWSFGVSGFLVGLYITGGWAIVLPFIVALAYWAIKVAVGLVSATIRGIKNASKNMPAVKAKVSENLNKVTEQFAPASVPAEQTA